MLKDLTNTLCPTDPQNRSYAELLVRSLMHQGLKGNIRAIKEIFNRLVGKVPLPIERVGIVPKQTDQRISPDWNSLSPARRLELTEEVKEKIREIYELESFEEEAHQNQD